MIRSARHSVTWAVVFKHLGLKDFRASLRVVGAGYCTLSRDALAFSPTVYRHWFNNVHCLPLNSNYVTCFHKHQIFRLSR